jgi:hypothetical protein
MSSYASPGVLQTPMLQRLDAVAVTDSQNANADAQNMGLKDATASDLSDLGVAVLPLPFPAVDRASRAHVEPRYLD